MQPTKSIVAGTITLVALALCQSSVAQAEVFKSGSQSCPSGEYVVLHGYGEGTMSYYYPSGVLKDTIQHGSALYGDTVLTGKSSTTWQVASSTLLYDAGTYASCQPGFSPAP